MPCCKYTPMITNLSFFKYMQVSICKFKFTGGDKPTLEEKKMLSVDAGGNFRYYSGTGDKKTMRGFEYLPREIMQSNASILTDRFTSLTADKLASNSSTNSEKVTTTTTMTMCDRKTLSTNLQSTNGSLKKPCSATVDIISTFEALPEKPDENIIKGK